MHLAGPSCTSKPHLALLPLPFVGSVHADGRLMGVALAIPRDVDPAESSSVLEQWLWDEHGDRAEFVFSMANGLNRGRN